MNRPSGSQKEEPGLGQGSNTEMNNTTDRTAAPSEPEGNNPTGCACGHKATPRDPGFQKDLQTRLNRAIGQLNGIKSMIDDNRYCGDVLTQLAAVEKAVSRISEKVLRDHLETCVADRIRNGDDTAIDEVMTLIRQFS